MMLTTLRRPTTVEALTLLAICGLLASLLCNPDTATRVRWSMERRARDWRPTVVPMLADPSLIAKGVDIAGKWSNRSRLTGSTLAFTDRPDGRYEVQFASAGCLGRCQLSRTAAIAHGTITMDGAVAEYSGPTYGTLYALQIDGTDYLLPAASVSNFQRKFTSGTADWQFYVFQRDAVDTTSPILLDHFDGAK